MFLAVDLIRMLHIQTTHHTSLQCNRLNNIIKHKLELLQAKKGPNNTVCCRFSNVFYILEVCNVLHSNYYVLRNRLPVTEFYSTEILIFQHVSIACTVNFVLGPFQGNDLNCLSKVIHCPMEYPI